MENIILKPGTFLVKPLPDYFKSANATFREQTVKAYDVGEIVMAPLVFKNKQNLICYYHSNVGEEISIIGVGNFIVVSIESVIIYLKQK